MEFYRIEELIETDKNGGNEKLRYVTGWDHYRKPGLFRSYWEAFKVIGTWALMWFCIVMVGIYFMDIIRPDLINRVLVWLANIGRL